MEYTSPPRVIRAVARSLALALLAWMPAPALAQDAEVHGTAPVDSQAPPPEEPADREAAPSPVDEVPAATQSVDDGAEVTPLEVIPLARPAPPLPEAEQPSSDRQVQEITVTAAYREQSVQDVVGGAQVFGGAALDAAGVAGMEDYLLEVPSVSLQKSGNGSAKISIRGISNVNASDLGYGAGSPTSGVYLNDVAIQGSGVFPDLNLFDLNRVEVLKGPQGTLYGEGSMGGAIKMISMAPDMEEWIVRTAGSVTSTADGDEGHDVRLAVNVPLVQDRLAARLVASQRRSGGFVDYTTLDRKDADSEDDLSLRGVVAYRPTEMLELEYLYFYQDTDRKQFPTVDEGREQELTNSREEDQYALTEFSIHALTARWDLPFAQLTSVSAVYATDRDSRRRTPVLQSLLQTQFRESGQTAPDIFSNASTRAVTELESFSQELRLVSAGDERLDWIFGLFYRDRNQTFDQQKREDSVPEDPTGLFTGILGGFNPVQGQQESGFGDETFEQIAAYSEINFELMPETLELTGGLRLFREDISFFIDTQFYGAEAFLIGSDPQAIDPETRTARKYFAQSLSTKGLLPKLSLSWHPAEDHMIYATVARGFRSGTPNIYAALEAGPPVVKPDYVWNKEIGFKSTWLGGSLITNLAVYHIDWEAIQGTVTGQAQLGLVPTDFAYLANAGDAELIGSELSLNWLTPLDGLGLLVNLGFNDGKVAKPDPASDVVKNSELPNNPRFTGSSTLSYQWRLPQDLGAEVSATYSYIDKQSVTFEVEGYDTFEIDAYDLFKASVSLSGEKWRVQLFGDNLLDNRAIVAISAPIAQYTVITPRQLGLRVSYDF